MKPWVAAVLLAGLTGASVNAHAEDKKWSDIRLVTEGAFRPWNYTNPDGTLGGFEIDLAADLCRRMQVHCTMEAQAFDSLIPSLNAGKFDAIIAGMSATAKREQVIAFSVPYGTTGQTFATLKDGPLAKLPDTGTVFSLETDEAGAIKELAALKPMLQGKVIGVQTASIAAAFLAKYLPGAEVREYKTTEQHDLDLQAGRVDVVMASMAYLKSAAERPANDGMVVVGPRFQGGMLGRGSSIGLRKTDPELKVMFDTAIHGAQEDGTIKRLAAKYFGFDITPR